MNERTYMVGSEDENGDQHVFMSEDLERAIAALTTMQERYGNVMTNAGLKDAMQDQEQRQGAYRRQYQRSPIFAEYKLRGIEQ